MLARAQVRKRPSADWALTARMTQVVVGSVQVVVVLEVEVSPHPAGPTPRGPTCSGAGGAGGRPRRSPSRGPMPAEQLMRQPNAGLWPRPGPRWPGPRASGRPSTGRSPQPHPQPQSSRPAWLARTAPVPPDAALHERPGDGRCGRARRHAGRRGRHAGRAAARGAALVTGGSRTGVVQAVGPSVPWAGSYAGGRRWCIVHGRLRGASTPPLSWIPKLDPSKIRPKKKGKKGYVVACEGSLPVQEEEAS